MEVVTWLRNLFGPALDLGRATRATEPSPANLRAAARLNAHREAQAERLKDAERQPPSRQAIRQALRRDRKMHVGSSQALWHRENGFGSVGKRNSPPKVTGVVSSGKTFRGFV